MVRGHAKNPFSCWHSIQESGTGPFLLSMVFLCVNRYMFMCEYMCAKAWGLMLVSFSIPHHLILLFEDLFVTVDVCVFVCVGGVCRWCVYMIQGS